MKTDTNGRSPTDINPCSNICLYIYEWSVPIEKRNKEIEKTHEIFDGWIGTIEKPGKKSK